MINRAPPLARVTPDLLADILRDEIGRGAPPPGGALRQEELAARFGVSRIPVREALRRLEAEGLVEVQPNRGAFVRRFTPSEVREVYDLRQMLEPDLVRRAVERMSEADVAEIEAAMLLAEQGARGPAWRELDNRFHAALYAPAGRPRQSALVMGLRGTIAHYRAADRSLAAARSHWLEDHRALLTACRERDAEGSAAIVARHLQRAAEMTLANMPER